MTVYVLCVGWDYEGEALLGVYGSLADARVVADAYEGGDALFIYERELGAPAELYDTPVWER